MKTTRFRALSCAVICVTGLAAILCASAGAAFPGGNGKLVFTSTQNGPRHIFATVGNSWRDLTGADSDVAETQPEFSPNGRKIAFTRSGEIWVMSAAGTRASKLTKTKAANSSPAWSPDGKHIAFVSTRKGRKPDVWVMHADGTHAKRLTHNSATESELAWSPAGKAIAFQRVAASGGDPAIYSMKPDGSHVGLLASSAMEPDYSPDGAKIVYSGPFHPSPPGSEGPDLWTMRANGANQKPLIHEGSSFYSDGAFPAWSPDGSTIAFTANNGTGYLHVYEVPASGGTSTEVVPNNESGNPLDQELDWQPLAH